MVFQSTVMLAVDGGPNVERDRILPEIGFLFHLFIHDLRRRFNRYVMSVLLLGQNRGHAEQPVDQAVR